MAICLPGRTPPVQDLNRQLEKASAFFKEAGAKKDYRQQRVACLVVLWAIQQYIRQTYDFDRGCEVGAPFDELAYALVALDDGVAEPILQPAKVKGRRRNARATAARAAVAALLAWLIDRKNPRRMRRIDDAAKMIAAKLTKRGRRTTAREIIGWRKEALRRPRNDPLRRHYEFQLQFERHLQKTLDWDGVMERLAAHEGCRVDPVAALDSLRFLPPRSPYGSRS